MVPCRREGGVKNARPPLPLAHPAPAGDAPMAQGRRAGVPLGPAPGEAEKGEGMGGHPRLPRCPPLLTPTLGGRMRLPTEAFSCSVAAEVAALPTRSGAWMGLIRM